MLESEIKVPAALNLPFGQLFFGFNVAQYTPPSPPPGSPAPGSQVGCTVRQFLINPERLS